MSLEPEQRNAFRKEIHTFAEKHQPGLEEMIAAKLEWTPEIEKRLESLMKAYFPGQEAKKESA